MEILKISGICVLNIHLPAEGLPEANIKSEVELPQPLSRLLRLLPSHQLAYISWIEIKSNVKLQKQNWKGKVTTKNSKW